MLLERQHALGLDAVDLVIIMQIAKHWYVSSDLPFPSKESLATCMGVSKRTIQRRLSRLEESGFIKRHERWRKDGGRNSNSYSFEGLIREAKPYAVELRQEREEHQRAQATRRRRKISAASRKRLVEK